MKSIHKKTKLPVKQDPFIKKSDYKKPLSLWGTTSTKTNGFY